DHAGCRPGVPGSAIGNLADLVPVAPDHEVVLKAGPAAVEADLGPQDVVGRREDAGPDAESAGQVGRDLGQALPGGETCGAGHDEREFPVTDPESIGDAVPGELVVEGEGVVASTPTLGALDPGQGVQHGVDVG